ncbi:hypothetical protein C0J52_00731 [Blattella germanica]|nr:hypothetical protein C0J52_00731 [Blattella germanica]
MTPIKNKRKTKSFGIINIVSMQHQISPSCQAKCYFRISEMKGFYINNNNKKGCSHYCYREYNIGKKKSNLEMLMMRIQVCEKIKKNLIWKLSFCEPSYLFLSSEEVIYFVCGRGEGLITDYNLSQSIFVLNIDESIQTSENLNVVNS